MGAIEISKCDVLHHLGGKECVLTELNRFVVNDYEIGGDQTGRVICGSLELESTTQSCQKGRTLISIPWRAIVSPTNIFKYLDSIIPSKDDIYANVTYRILTG